MRKVVFNGNVMLLATTVFAVLAFSLGYFNPELVFIWETVHWPLFAAGLLVAAWPVIWFVLVFIMDKLDDEWIGDGWDDEVHLRSVLCSMAWGLSLLASMFHLNVENGGDATITLVLTCIWLVVLMCLAALLGFFYISLAIEDGDPVFGDIALCAGIALVALGLGASLILARRVPLIGALLIFAFGILAAFSARTANVKMFSGAVLPFASLVLSLVIGVFAGNPQMLTAVLGESGGEVPIAEQSALVEGQYARCTGMTVSLTGELPEDVVRARDSAEKVTLHMRDGNTMFGWNRESSLTCDGSWLGSWAAAFDEADVAVISVDITADVDGDGDPDVIVVPGENITVTDVWFNQTMDASDEPYDPAREEVDVTHLDLRRAVQDCTGISITGQGTCSSGEGGEYTTAFISGSSSAGGDKWEEVGPATYDISIQSAMGAAHDGIAYFDLAADLTFEPREVRYLMFLGVGSTLEDTVKFTPVDLSNMQVAVASDGNEQ